MSADSPRRNIRGVPATVPPQVVNDRSIIDSVAGFINDVTLAHQPQCDPKDTITWARFETTADISDPRFGEDWELEGNVAPPLLLILGYGQGVQVWAIPANGEAVEVLSWRHGMVSALRILPTPSIAENGRADEPVDTYSEKRPLMAICDGTTPAGSNPQFCAINFVSLKVGAQVKTIKFKNPVLDILANRSSIVITFHERIAVFDARSLEDRLSITTCFPSPGINPNPVALGSRWMAYSENKLLHSKRSGGGCDGDGVSSYTATVLNAAKSFGKGLRELGEQVAAGLTGTSSSSGLTSKSSSFDSGTGDVRQPGVVTILDIKNPIRDVSPTSGTPISINGSDPIVAHFIAHSEAVVAIEFDNSGMMLLTADRRGHDFHIFRIQPHPVGSSLAAVHHLYVLHRGDTSAKVQNIAFSLDSRWVAVSTLRGTTHVFPITPYGGPAGVRTHTSLHVVNKLSRFHRSAGLTADGRSSSPISHSDSTNFSQVLMPYHNPTLPPFPRPTVVLPLAQLRQPFVLGSPPGSATSTTYTKPSSTRQRLSSLSDDNGKPLSVCAVFAKSRSWLLDPPNMAREAPHKIQRKAVDSLFIMAGHGSLIQYDLDTKLATTIAKEKICDDTPIELEVEAKAQWNLGRKDGSPEITAPLLSDNWLIKDRNSCMLIDSTRQFDDNDGRCDSWLSQVEIITHAGPHRRLWMGPQFVFKTYNTPSGSNLSHIDIEAVEIGVTPGPSNTCRPERSSPLNMPISAASRSSVPVLIESGSYSSIEQSPKLMDRFRHEHMNSDYSVAHGDTRLKEDLADAMRESPSVSHKDAGEHLDGCRFSTSSSSRTTTFSTPSSSPLIGRCERRADYGDITSSTISSASSSNTTVIVGGDRTTSSPMLTSTAMSSSHYESFESLIQEEPPQQQPFKSISIENVVNPLGTVTTILGNYNHNEVDDIMKEISEQDYIIHENCDESLFRPVVTIFCDDEKRRLDEKTTEEISEYTKPPEAIPNKLVVPVIEKSVDQEITRMEILKTNMKKHQKQVELKDDSDDEVVEFNVIHLNKKLKEKEKQKIQTNKDSHAVPHSSKEVIRAEIKPKRCDKVSSKIDIERVIKDEVLYPRENDKKDIEFLKDLERSEQISTTQKEKNSLQLKQRGKSDAMVDKEIVTKGSTSGCQEKQQVQETKRREKVSSSTEKASIEKVQTSGKKNYKKGSVKEPENVNRDEVEHLETSKKEKHKTRTSVESSYIEDVSLRCKKPDASGLDELVPSNSVSSSASKLTKESLSVSSEHDDSNQKECTSSTREKITKKRRSLTSKADEKTNSPVGTELVNKEDDLSTQEDLNKKLKKTEQKKQQSVKDTIQSDDVSGYQERGAAEKQLAAGNHDSKGSIKESEDVNRVNVLSSPDSITKKPTKTEKQNKNDPNQIVSTKRKKITMESRSMSSDNEYPISSELVSSIREQTPADTQRDDSLKQNEKNDSILKAEQEISNTREKGGKKLQKSEKQRAPVVKDRSPNESDSNTPNNVVTKNRTQSSKSDNNKAGPSSTQSPAYYMYIPNKNNKDERQHQSASPDENEPGSLQDETLPSLQGTSKKIKAKANKCTGPFNILGDLDTTKNYKAEMDLSKPTKGVSEGGEISNVETKITKSKTKLPKESKNSEEGQKENSKDGLQKDSVTETTMQTKKNRAKGTESASLQDEATCSPKNSLTGITSSKKHPGKVIEVRSQGEHVDSAQETSPIDMTTLKSEGKSDLISASTQGIHSQSAMNIKENVTKQTEKNSGNTAKDVSQVETDSGAKETSVHSNSDFRKKSSLKTRKINEAGLTNPDMKEDETKNVTKETQDIHSSPDSSVNKNVPLKSETHRHSLNTSKDHSESFVALEEETKVSKIQKSLAIDITSHSLEREVDMTHPSAPTTSNLAVSSKSDTDKRVKSKKECKGITVADEVGTTKELRSKLEKTKYSEKADKDAKNEVLEYASVVKTPPSSSLETEKDQKLSKTKKSENEATNIEKNVKKDASLSLTKLEIKNESSGTSKTRSRTTKNLSPECATVVGLSKIDQKIAKNHTQEAKNEAIEAVSDTPSAEPKGKRDSKAMETNISSKSEITTVENVSKMETKKDSVKPKLIKGTVTRVVTSEALEAETKPDTDSPSISRTQVGRSATSGFDNKYPLIKEDGRQIAENITSSATKAKKTKNSSCDQSVHKVIEAPSNKGVNLVDGQLDLSLLHGDVSVLLVDYCDKLDSDSDTLRMEIDLKHKKINGRGKFERIKVDTLPRSLIRTYATVVAGPDGDNSHILNTEYKLQEESSELVTKFKPKQTVKDDQLREYSDATKKQATSVDPTTVSPKPPNFIYKETHEIHEKSPTKEDQVQKCRDAPRLDQQTENKSKNPLEFSATVQKNTGIMEYSDVVKKSLSSSDQTTVGPMMKLRYIKCPDRKPKKSFEIGASESGSIKTNIKDEPKQKYSEVLGKPSTTEDQNTTFTKSAENKCEKTPEIDRPPSHPSTAMNIIMSGDTANPDEWQRKFSDYYNTKLRHVREAYPNLNFNDFIRLSDEEIKEAEMRLERQSSSDLRKYDPKFKNTYPILQKIGIRGNLEGDKKNKTTFYDAHAKKPAEDMWKPNFQDTKGKLHPCHSLEDIKNNDKPWIANSPDDAKTSHSKDLAGLYPFFDTNPPRNYHDSTVASIDSTKKKTTGSKTGDMARTISSNFSIKNDPYEAQNAQKSPITNRYGSSGSGSVTKLTNKDPWDTPRYVEEDFLSDTEYPALSKATKNRKSQSPVSERDQIIQNFSEFMSSLRDENHSLINLESPLQPVKLQPDCPTSSNTKLLPTETPIKLTPTTASGLLKSAPEKPIIPFRYFYIDYDFSLEETETPSSVTPKYRVFDGYNDYEITVDSDPPFTPSFISDDIPSDIEGKDWPKPRHSAFAPDDDEELRPLISNPLKNSQYLPSGMVKKKDTLPPLDNNHEHSDSSSSDQAITSDYYDNQLTLYAGAGSNTSTDNTSATDKSAEGETDLSTNLQSPQQLHSQQLHTNSTKKKLKRRKR